MDRFILKATVQSFTSVKAFFEEFHPSEHDAILTGRHVYDQFLKDLELPCKIILRDKYEKGEPSEAMVDQMIGEVQDCGIQRLVAIGGGSVIDTAKLMIIKGIRHCGPVIRGEEDFVTDKVLYAVPSTCGTGSEVSFGGIVTMKDDGLKTGILSPKLAADYAVLIPELIHDLPYKLFITCAIDALGHAMESFVSRTRSNVFVRAVGAGAISLILEGFVKMAKQGREVRYELLENFISASCLAGMASNNGGAGLVHALAYPLGEHYKVPHGESIQQFLCDVFAFYETEIETPELAELKTHVYTILTRAGYACDENAVFTSLKSLFEELLPLPSLRDYGMRQEEIRSFSQSVLLSKQRLLKAAPMDITLEHMESLFSQRY